MPQVLSLIADPQKSPLQKKQVDAATSALAAMGAQLDSGNWLAGNQAWQVEIDTCPADALTQLRQMADSWPVDINIVPTINMRKKLLVADMDSTMIEQECIDELAEAAGVGDAVRAVTKRAMNGELEFEDALRERVAALEGLPASVIGEVIDTRITLMPGGAQLITTMRQQGARCALISGGFAQFTAHVAAELGFHEHQANELLIEDNRLTGKVGMPILGQDAKVSALQRIAANLGISPLEALTVGDGANDVPMLQAAGLGVAVHAKPVVKAQVPVQIDHADLTALLFLQGITRDEFASAP
jgi:phosphoserine phosphatase